VPVVCLSDSLVYGVSAPLLDRARLIATSAARNVAELKIYRVFRAEADFASDDRRAITIALFMGFQKPKRMVQGDSRDLGDIRPSQFTGGMSRQRPLSYATISQPTATKYYLKPAPKNYRSQRELV
jgi:hypothetical protein